MNTADISIAGLGNVGRRLLELIERQRELLRARFELELRVVAACDTSGGAATKDGLDPARIIALKTDRQGIANYPGAGHPTMSVLDVASTPADIFVDLTLTNLKDGEPGLSAIRTALRQKRSVVTANKGPLVLAYSELAALARSNQVALLHSATVTGGLPTLNIGTRDLGAATITRVEGILNGTTNYILSRMSEGESYENALRHAQQVGMAEADPTLDVDGWDAANKLVIIANAVLRQPTTLPDLKVEGIRGIKPADLNEAKAQGQVVKLVALAEKSGSAYRLSVRPTRLDNSHPLANVGAGMMAIIYRTDINGTIFASIEEEDPYPTSAAVLRDIVNAAALGR